jgi:hypothetical protein
VPPRMQKMKTDPNAEVLTLAPDFAAALDLLKDRL